MRGARLVALAFLIGSGPVLAEVPSAVAPGHVPEPAGLQDGALHGYTPSGVKGGTVLDTDALATLIETAHPLLLDVAEQERKPPSMGKDTPWLPTHRSIPGAVFLEGAGKGTEDAAYAEAFRARIASLAQGDRDTPLVTFCHPDCWGSYNAAKRLVGLGYTHVYWYRDGTEGWQADHETRVARPDPTWTALIAKDVTQ